MVIRKYKHCMGLTSSMIKALGMRQVRSEERDHIGHAHDHADQHHIRHLEYGNADKAQHSDDGGVDDLPDDKPPKISLLFLVR